MTDTSLDETRRHAIESFHRSGARSVLAITGGGTGLIPMLLSVPGGSQSLLEGIVPYSDRSLADWLGVKPDRACDDEVALMLAAQAAERAKALGGGDASLGFGMTAALASNRPRRGTHRIHAAVQTATEARLRTVVLAKGERTREQEEAVCADVGLSLLADATDENWSVELTTADVCEDVVSRTDPVVAPVRFGRASMAWWNGSEFAADGPDGVAVLSGSFNPPHHGHAALRHVAADWLGGPVHYELPIRNADKPPLDDIRLLRRLTSLDGWTSITAADTFVRKASIFPGKTFVVGIDTAARIVDPRYYPDGIDAAFATLRDAGCRFLVAARLSLTGLQTLEDITVPPGWSDLFEALPADRFREDISSTELRRSAVAGNPPATDRSIDDGDSSRNDC